MISFSRVAPPAPAVVVAPAQNQVANPGSSRIAATTPPPTAPLLPVITQTNTVDIKDGVFTPNVVVTTPGALVTWTNYDLRPLTITGEGFDSGVLSEGAVWSRQFTSRGRFAYHSSIHPEMQGVIEVK